MSLKLLVFVILGILGFGLLVSGKTKDKVKFETPIAVSAPAPEVTEVSSIEGSLKLIMTKKQNDTAVSYSFTVSDQTGKKTPIFSKTAVTGETMALSRNSWSPNNKHFFIEDKIGTQIDYLVFKVNGESFSNGENFLNATALFNQKVKNYNLKGITGWDDPVLLSVRTVNGPHFWFDLTTQSFIQLAR